MRSFCIDFGDDETRVYWLWSDGGANMMAFSEAYAVINLALIVGVMVFSVENDCGTVWKTVTTLGASCPT